MDFEWLNDSRTSNKPDEITPPRSPRLPAAGKVTRICGNLTTSHWLKVRTLTEGCGRVSGSGGRADWPMSLLGQKRKWRHFQILSAVPSTTDIRRGERYVCICANRRLIHRSKRYCCRPDRSGPELAAARQKANNTKIRGVRQLTDVPRIRH
jgi:hypothetical protein